MEHSDDTSTITPEWCEQHFDYTAPALAQHMNETLDYMRGSCPVAHTDQHGGHWVFTRYDDCVAIAQDWRTFSSADGVSVDRIEMATIPLPEVSDPPIQREYKRLINPFFTPAAVRPHEDGTRELVTEMIDAFIERGECEFMDEFARPYPSMTFFETYLNAPPDEAAHMAELSNIAVTPGHPGSKDAWIGMFQWINQFLDTRRAEPPKGDVVDAVLGAEIDGRPITEGEVTGIIQLLILGGLDTTTGALGQFMIRFCQEPHIPELIRNKPDRLNDVVEELLRLEGPFVSIGRKALADAEVSGAQIKEGERVLFYWASANRDEAEFPNASEFDIDRESNRHLAFGIGPHRCAGSNLARMNLRIAIHEIVHRMRDLELACDPSEIHYHSVHNRAPLTVPIRFTPAGRSS